MKKNEAALISETVNGTVGEKRKINTAEEEEEEEEEGGVLVAATKVPAKRGRKKREPGVRIPFDPNWFPVEWMAFVVHGAASETPCRQWNKLAFSQGPKVGNIDLTATTPMDGRSSLGRKAARSANREEKRNMIAEFEEISPLSSSVVSTAKHNNANKEVIEIIDELKTTNKSAADQTNAINEQTKAINEQTRVENFKLMKSLIDIRTNLTEAERNKMYEDLYDRLLI